MPQPGEVVTVVDLDGRPTGHFRVQHASHRKLAMKVITATAFREAAHAHNKELADGIMIEPLPTIQK